MAHRSAFRQLLRDPMAVAGLVGLGLIAGLAALAPLLFPGDPLDMVAQPFLWPGADPEHPLGTDLLGRDIAAGIAHGARVSVLIGFASTAIGILAGTLVGALAGYLGGRADDLLARATEVVQTFPAFLLVVVLVAIAGPNVLTITLAIGGVSWPTIARMVRAEFRSLRQRDFIVAAEGLGYGHARIILAEMLPNALPPVVVTASVMVATAILNEAALAFLGLGDPNLVSWGSMIGAGRDQLRTAWYLVGIPGVALVIAVLALNLLGEALTDALDPRARTA
ncbi:ABC transporter permease [Paracraurococcus lichenis]|uniref:ABC transporter permease n=1 Tax=Paracraurococcus lichenis TaxID=3064888 RepID=A0ABT9EAD3_9PROT|nr:ABC transporter permease [Paracraurococcus sp. LOR1-02]MDO9712875.1 ABC transporter permease [Paracraurococcus sp. LOR1-02]